MQYDRAAWILGEKVRIGNKARFCPVLPIYFIACHRQGFVFIQVLSQYVNIESNYCCCNEEEVYGLYEYEADKIGMVASTDTAVEPLAVMVVPIDALITDVAVAASR